MKPLWSHQQRALTELRVAIHRGARRPLVQAPTGAGKTRIAAAIIDGALAKGKRPTFTVPRKELIDQTVLALYAEGIRDVGVIQADHPMTAPERPVQIATPQTLRCRVKPETDLVIVDEAHIMFEFMTEWMSAPGWHGVPFIGLSATPWTKGLGRVYDHLIVCATTAGLIEDGRLVPFRVFAPSHPDLSGVRTTNTPLGRDYSEADLSKVMRRPTLIADVVQTWLLHGGGRPTLCFAVDTIHARALQQEFQAAGVACGYMDAHTPDHERKVIRGQFAAGDLQIVCNVGVLTTGVDWDVRCIILARPTKSEILYTQIVGRGLRTLFGPGFDPAQASPAQRRRAIAEGPKPDCLLLDHSDTTLRLGFVTDIHHEALDDGTISGKRDITPKEALPKECPKCSYVRAPKVSGCPNCGHVAEITPKVDVRRGELVELKPKRVKPADDDQAARIRFYRELLAYRLLMAKKESWALAKFKERYGEWPGPWAREARPASGVSQETSGWITHSNIAYAKRGAAR